MSTTYARLTGWVALCLLALTIRLHLARYDERGAASTPDWLSRLFSTPNLLLGVVGGFLNMMVLLGVWELTGEQTGGINMFFAALVALVAAVVTPNSQVVARQRGDGPVKAGKGAENGYGIPVGTTVAVQPSATPAPGVPAPGAPPAA